MCYLIRGDEYSCLLMLICVFLFWILVLLFIEIGCFKKLNFGLKEVFVSYFKDFDLVKVKLKVYVKECSELVF